MITLKNWTQDQSAKILELIKTELNWQIEVQEAAEGELQEPSHFEKNPVHKVCVADSAKILIHYPAQTERVKLLESLDCLLTVQGKQWPQLLMVDAIKRTIRRKTKTLDLNCTAYVVGETSEVRPLVMVATELGFARVTLVSTDEKFLADEIKFLSRRLVGVKIEPVLTSDLTLQPQDTKLLLNSFNLHKHKEYLHDLAYFNFMVSGGVVVDMHSDGPHQVLQEEAAKAQLACITPPEIILAWWLELALKMSPNLTFSKENENKLFEKLNEAGP